MFKPTLFRSNLDKVACEVLPNKEKEANYPTFSVVIKPFPYDIDVINYIEKKYKNGPVNGLNIILGREEDERFLTITFTPSKTSGFQQCDQDFRNAVSFLSGKHFIITSRESDVIEKAYQKYLDDNKIVSLLGAKTHKDVTHSNASGPGNYA